MEKDVPGKRILKDGREAYDANMLFDDAPMPTGRMHFALPVGNGAIGAYIEEFDIDTDMARELVAMSHGAWYNKKGGGYSVGLSNSDGGNTIKPAQQINNKAKNS